MALLCLSNKIIVRQVRRGRLLVSVGMLTKGSISLMDCKNLPT